MASIRTRTTASGDKRYTVEVRIKGFPPQTATFSRKTDAKAWAADTESAIRENRYFKTAEARKHTFAEMIDRYIEEVLPTKPKSVNQKQQLEFFKARIGAFALSDISAAKLVECRNELSMGLTGRHHNRTRSPATVNRYLAALSHVFTIAVNDWEWLEESPMRRVKKLPEPRGRVRFLSDDTLVDGRVVPGERSTLLSACQQVRAANDLYPFVVLALSTGMRHGEIASLNWSQVDLIQRRITLYDTKNGEIRVVPLVGHALELIGKRKGAARVRLPAELVFPSPKDPSKPHDLRAAWRSAVKKAKLTDFNFHDLRHCTASYLAMNGATPNEIAEVLGHKTLQMVKRYSHLSKAHMTELVEKMNERYLSSREAETDDVADLIEERASA